MADNTGVRINKFLSEAGVCSRREADRMVEQGRITIDDKPVTAGMRVHDGSVVRVDGRQVTKEEEEIFLAFYKPKGIVCTTAQEENGEPIKNVVDYIDYPKRVYPVGRLDQASEGLLLLTNQGDVMEKILRSRYTRPEYRSLILLLSTMPSSLFCEPTSTTTRFPLVTPVYRRFLVASIGGNQLIGMITMGNSLP